MPEVCPTCGQFVLIRRGAKLQHRKAELFDLIDKYTDNADGISLDRLAGLLYPDAPTPRAKERVKSHICQLNDVLAATPYRIFNRDGRYKLCEDKN